MSLIQNLQLDARLNLVQLLEQTKALVNSSKESVYSSFSPEEITTDLSIAIEALHKGGKLDRDQLMMHFSPTGSIQEIAMDSTWTDEYMSISEQFDIVIEKIPHMTKHNKSKAPRIGSILKKRGWFPLLMGLLVIRGMHGFPSAYHLLFKIGKQDIQSFNPEYSGHFMWEAQAGIFSFISLCLFFYSIYSIFRKFSKST